MAMSGWMRSHNFQKMGKFANARTEYQESLKLVPDSPQAKRDLVPLPH